MKSKMKKWGGIVLLAAMLAMMLGVGSAYAADEYEPIKGSADSVKIAKSLDLKGSTSGPEHTATFNISYYSVTPSGTPAPIGDVQPVSMTFSGDEVEKEAFIDFSTVSFNAPGIYRYRLRETITPTNLGIRTKPGTDTEYYIDVVVDNVNTGAGTSGLEVKSYALYKSDRTTKAKSLLFQNEWDNYRVHVKKNVTGNRGNKTKVFNVWVGLTNFGSSDKVIVRWVHGTPAARTENTKVTAANPVEITGSSSTTSYVQLYLKDGDEVIIEGMKVNMMLTAGENEIGNYKMSGDIATPVGVHTMNDETITIVNHLEGDIPTGVFINNWPYILVILVVIAGAILFIRRRKARYEYEADL